MFFNVWCFRLWIFFHNILKYKNSTKWSIIITNIHSRCGRPFVYFNMIIINVFYPSTILFNKKWLCYWFISDHSCCLTMFSYEFQISLKKRAHWTVLLCSPFLNITYLDLENHLVNQILYHLARTVVYHVIVHDFSPKIIIVKCSLLV